MDGALERIQQSPTSSEIFCTGSLYLCGDLLNSLQWSGLGVCSTNNHTQRLEFCDLAGVAENNDENNDLSVNLFSNKSIQ